MKLSRTVPAILCPVLIAGCGQIVDVGDPVDGPQREATDGTASFPPTTPDPSSTAFPRAMGDELTLAPPPLLADVGVAHARLAFDGAIYLAVWRGSRGLSAARIDARGTVLDAVPRVLAPTDAAGDPAQDLPQVVARAAGGFGVYWTGRRSSFSARVLEGVVVERSGAASVARSLNVGSDEWSLRCVVEIGPVAGQPWLTAYRAMVESGAQLRFVTFAELSTGFSLQRTDVVTLPRLAPGSATAARSDAGDHLAWVESDGAADEVVVASAAFPRGRDAGPVVLAEQVRERARVLAPRRAGGRAHEPVRLAAASGGAHAVWLDADGTGVAIGGPARVRAAFASAVGGAAPVVDLASGYLRDPRPSLAVAARGTSLFVGLRGTIWATSDKPLYDAATPVALVRNLESATTTKIEGDADALSLQGALLAVSSGDADHYVAIHSTPEPSSLSSAQIVPLTVGARVAGATSVRPSLLGKGAAQEAPSLACRRGVCLATLAERAPNGRTARAVRIDAASGRIMDLEPIDLGTASYGVADVRIAAHDDAFLAVGVGSSGGDCALFSRSIRRAGEALSPVRTQRLSEKRCPAVGVEVVSATDGFVALLIDRDGRKTYARFDSSGQPRGISETDAVDQSAIGVRAARPLLAAAGDRVLSVALEGGAWRTSVLDRGALVEAAGAPLPESFDFATSSQATARPVLVGDERGATLVWSWVGEGAPNVTIKTLRLGGGGKVAGAAQVVVSEPGELGALLAASDEDGVAIAYRRRTFAGEPYELLMRRLSRAEGATAGPARRIADGLVTEGDALVRAQEGQWLSAYPRYGDTIALGPGTSVYVAGNPASEVRARFIYDGSAARRPR